MLKKFLLHIWAEAYEKNTLDILSLLEENPQAKVLDVGCGDGQKTSRFMEKIGCREAIGIDGVADRLKAAKTRGIKIIKANLENKWPFPNNSFDVVVSNQVIEHIVDIDAFIEEIYRVLKPNGYAVISTENLASWHNIFALILGFQDFSHHIIKKLHIGNPLSPHYGEKTVTWSKEDNSGVDDTAFLHIKILTLRSLINVFKVYGFNCGAYKGSGYYPLFSFAERIISSFDPFHCHFIVVKMRKFIK